VARLDAIGYRGDYSFEVFNDDYRQMQLATVAAHGRRSAIWLSEAVAALVTQLDQIGYSGDYSFEVFNDDYQQMPLATVAARAYASALWIGEDVLKRSIPLPGQLRLRTQSDA
jgi:predicted xylose isomerase-like sugar epimerase